MKPVYSGKVREIYDISDEYLVIVTTDRISAFDHILTKTVKDKGVLLNRISNFWFAKTRDIVPNHIVSVEIKDMPSYFQTAFFKDRTVMVKKLHMFPFEFVVRGYLFGSMWEAYKNGEDFCQITLPAGCRQAQKLEQPVLTPAFKRDVGHDEYVNIKEVQSQLGAEVTKQITESCLKLYGVCSEYALSKGLILADAKFEFGQDREGKVVLADEIFTPDAGRYWDAAEYQAGVIPASYDKQFLRDWLLHNQVNGEFQFDKVPESVLARTGEIYRECLHKLVS